METVMTETINSQANSMAKQILAEKARKIDQMREGIARQYPHADPRSIRWDPIANKFAVEISCTKCGEARLVFTSDLFHVTMCVQHSNEAKAKARAEWAILRAQAMELLATGQVK